MITSENVAAAFDEVAGRHDLMVALNPGYHRHLRAAADALMEWLPRPGLARGGPPVALLERVATTPFLAANQLLHVYGVAGHDLWTVPIADVPARGLSVSPPHGALRVAAGWLPCDRVESAYLCSTPSPAEAAQRVLNLFVLTRGQLRALIFTNDAKPAGPGPVPRLTGGNADSG